jgi:hypothetical protein
MCILSTLPGTDEWLSFIGTWSLVGVGTPAATDTFSEFLLKDNHEDGVFMVV